MGVSGGRQVVGGTQGRGVAMRGQVQMKNPSREAVGLLQQAFQTFDQASAALQESYRTLTVRVERLDLELAASNEALRLNLRENELMRRHLAAILESLSTGVIVADDQGTVVRCNQAAVTFLGQARSRVLHAKLETVLRTAGLEPDAHLVAAPSGVLLSVTTTVLQLEAGLPAGRIVLLHDVTTFRQLEERLQRRDRLAAMGEMVGRMAHEIRNPLGSIELFASLLRRDLADHPEQRGYTEHISVSVRALDRLLSNLLIYTRPNQPTLAWHDTEAVILDALTMAAHAIAQARIEIPLCLDQNVLRLWCDAAQIKQVLVNLILNAIQAMPDGGALTVSVAPAGAGGRLDGWTRVTVSDTGTGIDPALHSRVFDPFFTTNPRGTGLGLAIAHALVEGHGGRIEIVPSSGKGTTFVMLLPPPGPSKEHEAHGRVPESIESPS